MFKHLYLSAATKVMTILITEMSTVIKNIFFFWINLVKIKENYLMVQKISKLVSLFWFKDKKELEGKKTEYIP